MLDNLYNLFLNLHPAQLLSIAVAGFGFLSIIAALEVIYRNRTPQSSLAWTMALIFIPFLGLLAYLVFGRRKFKGYVQARGLRKKDMAGVNQKLYQAIDPYLIDEQKQHQVLQKILGMPFVSGNSIEILKNAKLTYSALFDAIDNADNYILVAYYIIRDDKVGRELFEKLLEKTRQGLDVYLLYDEIGSWSLKSHFFQVLQEAGAEVRSFNSTKGLRNRFQLNFRNHRKLVIIDGHTLFAGGINIGKEYMSGKMGVSEWRDTHLKLQGPAALCAQMIFIEDWYWAGEYIPELDWQCDPSDENNYPVQIMATGPADVNLEACTQAYSYLFSRAKHRIWVTSPYFIPPPEIMNVLAIAALKGVDVRLLIPKKFDGILVKLSSFSFAVDALDRGIQVYQYKGFVHQKVFLIDDEICSIGSVNMDNRSFRLNFEANVIIDDKAVCQQVEQMLTKDFDNSVLIDHEKALKRPFIIKLLEKTTRLLAPLQ